MASANDAGLVMMISWLVTIRQQELLHCHSVVCRSTQALCSFQDVVSLIIIRRKLTEPSEHSLDWSLDNLFATGDLIWAKSLPIKHQIFPSHVFHPQVFQPQVFHLQEP
jgi:hypothetical protein